ncbi:4Fe-4S dicluster domain-containing protein [Inmirania thermothiophila]|uniref:4Fe-4S dicluster protein n=1 Tax=Inmirania thermothiophila TaxID=1750597 RepID=A0A3N1Y0J9_9GAMM|nr:4Fe-4S dicluster domain-containing protein [Inmirania thermothiophila]ROR32330.1 4Fe-4S dicluster protein [Inmirania thermothiophila]
MTDATPAVALPEPAVQRAAREAALAAWAQAGTRPPATVAYTSRGRLVVIGPGEAVAEVCRVWAATAPDLAVRAVCTEGTPPAGVHAARAGRVRVVGHLGRFALVAEPEGRDLAAELGLDGGADLVLDRQARPGVSDPLPPPGYRHLPPGDGAALADAVQALAELVGTFEKPVYTLYDPDRCARGRSGQSGCTRCLEACPTGAIADLAERVDIDPYRCQGAGACAAVCPGGAIRHESPRSEELREAIRRMLKAHREAGGVAPTLLVVAEGEAPQAEALPPHVLPLPVEEVGAVGMETWLAALAYGAGQVALALPEGAPAPVRDALRREVAVAAAILAGLGLGEERVGLLEGAAEAAALTDPVLPALAPAAYAAVEDKRTALRLAVDHLRVQVPPGEAEAVLPAHAPFGEVRVDRGRCTLCMACTSVCPTSALVAGGDTPVLRFIEANCVQCGICAGACPEQAITLRARYLYDPAACNAPRVLHEEAPFCCVVCGKPFATASVIARIRERVAGHPMFAGAAGRRLEMCEDCRVRDITREELERSAALPLEAQLRRLEG